MTDREQADLAPHPFRVKHSEDLLEEEFSMTEPNKDLNKTPQEQKPAKTELSEDELKDVSGGYTVTKPPTPAPPPPPPPSPKP
jgi:hypothetical protein